MLVLRTGYTEIEVVATKKEQGFQENFSSNNLHVLFTVFFSYNAHWGLWKLNFPALQNRCFTFRSKLKKKSWSYMCSRTLFSPYILQIM